MNMRGVFLHVLADALGSVVVIISALIMWQTEWEYKIYVDPALSILLVCIMMKVGTELGAQEFIYYRVSYPIFLKVSSCFVLEVPLPCLGSS